jgi:hypothetical protein
LIAAEDLLRGVTKSSSRVISAPANEPVKVPN